MKFNSILIFTLCGLLQCHCLLPKLFRSLRPNSVSQYLPEPSKLKDGAVLSVRHPETNCNVHLIGVSHGSEASATLVQDFLYEKKPSAVVLELCEDRFLTISSYAEISPRGNTTLIQKYNEIQSEMQSKIKKYNNKNPVQKIFSVLKFAKDQGLITGTFILFGVLVGTMQKLISATNDDEFTTAIRVADELKIPVRLGDAPQNDTLKSIRKIVSIETVTPPLILAGTQSLAFSALGLCAESSNPLPKSVQRPPSSVLSQSQWVNIPLAYMKDAKLSNSLRPIALIAMGLFLIEQLPIFSQTVDAAVLTTNVPVPELHWDPTTQEEALTASSAMISIEFGKIIESIQRSVDALSILMLVRMTKIIGTDRDVIIAEKVMNTCREFPNKEIVVVIGMLHCNGVARWLMSNVDPLSTTLPTSLSLSPPSTSSSLKTKGTTEIKNTK